MKEYCVDLEIAKELKINGFVQKAIWYWIFDNYNQTNFIQHECLDEEDSLLCSSPTTDELLKELPNFIIENNTVYYLNIFRDTYTCVYGEYTECFYYVSYATHDGKSLNAPNNICIEKDRLPNCLATLWIYLKKEGYIE